MPRIVLVGQVPIRQEPQLRLMLRPWEEQPLLADATDVGLDATSLATDARLQAGIAGSGAVFVSPIHVFCRADRCQTFSGPDRREPVAFDYGHLTRSASPRLATFIHAAFAAQEQHPP